MAYDTSIRDQAREQRRNGASVREIEQHFGISRGTASRWCVGVIISSEGKERLHQHTISNQARFQAEVCRGLLAEKVRERRAKAFTEGFNSNPTTLDALCVGLYWGEGSKYNQSWNFVNSDRETVALLVQWAERAGQPEQAFVASIQIHPEDGKSEGEIKTYWAEAGIPSNNIRVYRLRTPTSKKSVKGRVPCGTCRVLPIKGGARLYQFYLGQRSQCQLTAWLSG